MSSSDLTVNEASDITSSAITKIEEIVQEMNKTYIAATATKPQFTNEQLLKMPVADVLRLGCTPEQLGDLAESAKFDTIVEWAASNSIIYIAENTGFAMDNCFRRNKRKPVTLSVWDPELKHGWYAVKLLSGGFDLSSIDHPHISSQKGPKKSFDQSEHKWGLSLKSRGYELGLHHMNCFGPDEDSSKMFPTKELRTTVLPAKTSGTRKWHSTFLILFDNMNIESTDTFVPINAPSTESTDGKVYLIKAKNGIVKGYKLTDRAYQAFNPYDDPSSDEGFYVFSFVWYRVTDIGGPSTGFIITGNQSDYNCSQCHSKWEYEYYNKAKEYNFPDRTNKEVGVYKESTNTAFCDADYKSSSDSSSDSDD